MKTNKPKNTRRSLAYIMVLIMLIALVPFEVQAEDPGEFYNLGYQPPGDNLADFYHSVTIDGVFWEVFRSEESTGSGKFEPFVRFDAPKDGITRAYNTDAKKPEFQTKPGPFTHSITLAEIPFGVKMSGSALVAYGREFAIDINESANDTSPELDLDDYEVWLTSDPEITGYNPTGEGYASQWSATNSEPEWVGEIDWNFQVGNSKPIGPIDRKIRMDYRVENGSGWGDYRVLIPDHYFSEALERYNTRHPGVELTPETAYMVLFVQHSLADGGFEEWGIRIADPATKSGTKFNDLNANGVQDLGELGLEGWTIYVDYNDNDVLDEGEPFGVSGSDGAYIIGGIDPGVWKVKELLEPGWIQTFPGEANDYCYLEIFTSGAILEGNDFGNVLIDPEINIIKTGDELSKIGDLVDYTITVQNLSGLGTPDIDIHIVDTMLGIDQTITMATGDPDHIITVAGFEIPTGATDPFRNIVTAEAICEGLAEAVTASAIWDVNLFQPSIDVTKTGDELSKIGDTVTYVISLINNSSPDTPDLEYDWWDDQVATGGSVTLSSGATETITLPGFVIPEGAADPFVNTVYVTASPIGFPNVYTDSAVHNVDLFGPSINVLKTGDALSKIGDEVTYVITLENNSTSDTPDMEFEYSDPLLGITGAATLSSGATEIITLPGFVIPEGAADPFVNTVYVTASPIGFPNIYTDSAVHNVDLFGPSINVLKTGDALSKIGDEVTYVITLENNSTSDTPDMEFEYSDPLLGITGAATLSSGATETITLPGFVIPEGAADPFVNTVYVTASPIGFPNVYTDSAVHNVDLFGPSINVLKTGDALSKIGDEVTYVITLENNSTSDTPDMEFEYSDPLLGITGAATLSSGATEIITLPGFVIPEGAADPFVNTVYVTASPIGFPNVYTDSAVHNVDLFQPSIEITKEGDLTGRVGEPIHYTVVVTNTSSLDSPNLIGTLSDSLVTLNLTQAAIDLAPGETHEITYTYTPDENDPKPLINTATVITNPDNFQNIISAQAIWEVNFNHPETSWGYNREVANDFLDSSIFNNPKFNNWGWSNGSVDVSSEGSIELRLLAGAGTAGKKPNQYSDVDGAIDVGSVVVSWSAGHVAVTYNVDDPNILEDVHLWVGEELLPTDAKDKDTNAPGQFPYDGVIADGTCTIEIPGTFTGEVYIAAHAVVLIPSE